MFGAFIFFVIVGVIAILVRTRYTVNANGRIDVHKTAGIVTKVAFVLAAVFLVMASAVVVPAGNVGVQVFFGDVETDELESGFHVINPLIEINNMDVRTQAYTMSAVHDEGQK